MAGLFLKHTLQVPLKSNRSAQTLFPATGAIPGYPRSTTKYMDSDGVIITLDIILPLLILRQDLLEQLLKHGDFVRRQIFR